MGKYDNNGVKHDGWVAVRRANQQHTGKNGSSSHSYEHLAKRQGVNLANTQYKNTDQFTVADWEEFYAQKDWYGFQY